MENELMACWFCNGVWGSCTCAWPDPDNHPGFEHEGMHIIRPNVSVCSRFYVNPIAYYGRAFLEWVCTQPALFAAMPYERLQEIRIACGAPRYEEPRKLEAHERWDGSRRTFSIRDMPNNPPRWIPLFGNADQVTREIINRERSSRTLTYITLTVDVSKLSSDSLKRMKQDLEAYLRGWDCRITDYDDE